MFVDAVFQTRIKVSVLLVIHKSVFLPQEKRGSLPRSRSFMSLLRELLQRPERPECAVPSKARYYTENLFRLFFAVFLMEIGTKGQIKTPLACIANCATAKPACLFNFARSRSLSDLRASSKLKGETRPTALFKISDKRDQNTFLSSEAACSPKWHSSHGL